MEWTFDARGPVEAQVSLPAGMIEVEGGAEDRVTVVLEPFRDGHRGVAAVAASEVHFDGRRLGVRVPDRHGGSVELRCVLALPEGSTLTTTTASAEVRSSVRLGAFDHTTASGDVAFGEVDGDVHIRTHSGDIAGRRVGGAAKVRTASGDLAINRAEGDVDVNVASGDVDIADAARSVTVKSASGDIRVGRVRTGRVRADTASGAVRVGVPTGVGAFLDCSSVSGELICDLPVNETPAGQADLEILCRTVSGDVRIEAAP